MNITSQKKIIALFAGLAVLIAVVAGIGTLVYRTYWKLDDSTVVRSFARVLSLPAAKVGSRSVTYEQFMDTREAVNRFIASEAGQASGVNAPPEAELNKNVLERLIHISMVQELAEQRKLVVSDDDVRAVFSDVVKAAASSTTPNVAEYLYKNYGWNEEDFRQQVLRPALLEQKVSVEMAKEKQGDGEAMNNELIARREKSDVVVYLKF